MPFMSANEEIVEIDLISQERLNINLKRSCYNTNTHPFQPKPKITTTKQNSLIDNCLLSAAINIKDMKSVEGF